MSAGATRARSSVARCVKRGKSARRARRGAARMAAMMAGTSTTMPVIAPRIAAAISWTCAYSAYLVIVARVRSSRAWASSAVGAPATSLG